MAFATIIFPSTILALLPILQFLYFLFFFFIKSYLMKSENFLLIIMFNRVNIFIVSKFSFSIRISKIHGKEQRKRIILMWISIRIAIRISWICKIIQRIIFWIIGRFFMNLLVIFYFISYFLFFSFLPKVSHHQRVKWDYLSRF